jgi:hypothetical protein
MREMSKIISGKCVDQERNIKEWEFVWVTTTIFTQDVFVHEDKVERKKESLELLQPWSEKLLSMLEHIWSELELETKYPVCHAQRVDS